MSTRILALMFVAPFLVYAIHILREEFKDPLLAFHDSFRAETKLMNSNPFPILAEGSNRFSRSHSELGENASSGIGKLINPLNSRDRQIAFSLITWNLENKCVFTALSFFLLYGLLAFNFGVLLFIGAVGYGYLLLLSHRQRQEFTRTRENLEAEFPAIVELIAILIVAGESPSRALERVAQRTESQLTVHIREAVEVLRSGGSISQALDALARGTQSLAIRRFCDALLIALERGTPLSDVLHRQVEDIRSQNQVELIKRAGRAEIALMVPVVFLILPISILFALWPSYLALGQSLL